MKISGMAVFVISRVYFTVCWGLRVILSEIYNTRMESLLLAAEYSPVVVGVVFRIINS